MQNNQYYLELSKGIPMLTGHFGTAFHKPSKTRHVFFFHDWDILFLEKGEALLQLKNREPFRFSEGHFLLLPPSVPLWYQCLKPVSLNFCHISFTPIPEYVFPSVRNDCLEIGKKVLVPWIISKHEAHKFWLAYRRVVAMEFNAKKPWKMLCAVSRMLAELGAFALKLELPDDLPVLSPSDALDSRIIDICRRIARTPFSPWKVSDLAKSIGISVGHLDRLFHTNLRTNLKKFIVERRMQAASRFVDGRLFERRYSVKEISVECGFSSQQFFSRQFKKFYGVSPSKYMSCVKNEPDRFRDFSNP